jgi:hypothetical protein
MTLDLDDARKRYEYSLSEEDRERLPFYTALTKAFAHDEIALTMLAGVRVEQRNPMLVLASLHLAALKGHPILAPLYREVRRGATTDPSTAATTVLDVVHAQPELVESQLHRSTQTNEPGRSAVFQAVMAIIASRGHDKINIVDVGTSAGINLYFDLFPVRSVDDDDPLTLVCRDNANVDRSRALPTVASRVGIDPSPLDIAVEDERLWLQACLWPEEPRRMVRLDAFIAARPSWPSTTVLQGTAHDRLPDALAEGDDDVLTVVMNSWVAAYFSESEQRAYFEELSRRCATENVAWVSIESPFAVKWPTSSTTNELAQRGAQILVTLPGGVPTEWGWCHHHGLWLELDVSD